MSTIKKLFATTLTASILFCSVTFPGMLGPLRLPRIPMVAAPM